MVSSGSIRTTSVSSEVREPAAATGRRARAVAVRCAYASILAGLLGAAFVSYGVSALPQPWTRGYVSEAGALSAQHHTVYRIGVAALAFSIGMLAAAVASTTEERGGRQWLRWAPAAWIWLAVGAVLGSVSSRVSCTTGCPLPPYQATTAQDLVHAATSVGSVGFATLAMLTIAVVFPVGRMRRLARWGVAVCLPPLVFLAVAILAIGHNRVTAITERASLVLVLAWVVASAAALARPKPS